MHLSLGLKQFEHLVYLIIYCPLYNFRSCLYLVLIKVTQIILVFIMGLCQKYPATQALVVNLFVMEM